MLTLLMSILNSSSEISLCLSLILGVETTLKLLGSIACGPSIVRRPSECLGGLGPSLGPSLLFNC